MHFVASNKLMLVFASTDRSRSPRPAASEESSNYETAPRY